jgi:lipopolysaccharide/colanic/teichoic acid biosynthesis glycosyltransferase
MSWAQIKPRPYDTAVADVKSKLQYELRCILRRSLLEDFRIMVRTSPAVLVTRGAW